MAPTDGGNRICGFRFFRPKLEDSEIKTESRADGFKTTNMAEGLPKPIFGDEVTPTQVIDLVSDEEPDENEYWDEEAPQDDEPEEDEPEYGAIEDEQDRVYGGRRYAELARKRSRPDFQEWRTTHAPDEKPDLAIYFDRFVMDDASRIAMCRTYASYLSAKNRPNGGVRGAYKKRTLGTKLQ